MSRARPRRYARVIRGCTPRTWRTRRRILENVNVGDRGDRQVALTDELADPGPRNAAQVLERDPPVSKVVRQNAGTAAAVHARPIATRSRSAVTPWNTHRSGVR